MIVLDWAISEFLVRTTLRQVAKRPLSDAFLSTPPQEGRGLVGLGRVLIRSAEVSVRTTLQAATPPLFFADSGHHSLQ